jgi:hypothetical protein
MSGFANPIIGGGGSLVYPSIHSPNYAAGTSGWTIKKDGSAEFNNLTIRGTFDGTDFIINSGGAFFYSGTPAAGNLIASITSASGTDSFGNTYQQGITSYQGGAAGYVKMLAGLLNFSNSAGISTGNSGGSTTADTLAFGSGGGLASLFLDAQSWISVPLSASDPSQPTTTRETWHNVSGGAGFASAQWADGVTPMAYKLLPDNTVAIRGTPIWTSNGVTGLVSGQAIFTLPAGYRPAVEQFFPAGALGANRAIPANSVPLVEVTPAGVVSILELTCPVTNGDQAQPIVSFRLPLD